MLGTMAIRSFFVAVKRALAVNRNMTASAPAAAFPQSERGSTPRRRGP
jgi:hypothetical protein